MHRKRELGLTHRGAPLSRKMVLLRDIGVGALTGNAPRKAFRLHAKLLAIGLLFSGVLINPLNPAQTSKIVVADLFFLVGSVLFLLSSINRYGALVLRIHQNTRVIFLILGAFLFWVFLSGLIAMFVYDQPLGKFVLTFANYSYGALICIVIVSATAMPGNARLFIIAYTLGVVFVSSFSALAMFAEAPAWVYHGGGRIKSTSQSVNQLAAFVAPAIPLVLILGLGRSVSKSTTLVFLFAGALASIALIGTGSRTALVLLVVSLLLVVLAALLYWPSKSGLASAILLSCIATALGLVVLIAEFKEVGSSAIPSFAQALARPLDRFLSPDTVEAGLGPRYDQIVAVWSNWVNHPVFGIGPGNFKSFSSSDFEVHNTYLGTLVEIGVPGLIFLLLFQAAICVAALVKSFSPGPIEERIQAFAVFSAFLIVSLYGFGSFGLRQRPFWIQAGFAIGILNHYWMVSGLSTTRYARCSA
jgi:O-antigen ligase